METLNIHTIIEALTANPESVSSLIAADPAQTALAAAAALSSELAYSPAEAAETVEAIIDGINHYEEGRRAVNASGADALAARLLQVTEGMDATERHDALANLLTAMQLASAEELTPEQIEAARKANAEASAEELTQAIAALGMDLPAAAVMEQAMEGSDLGTAAEAVAREVRLHSREFRIAAATRLYILSHNGQIPAMEMEQGADADTLPGASALSAEQAGSYAAAAADMLIAGDDLAAGRLPFIGWREVVKEIFAALLWACAGLLAVAATVVAIQFITFYLTQVLGISALGCIFIGIAALAMGLWNDGEMPGPVKKVLDSVTPLYSKVINFIAPYIKLVKEKVISYYHIAKQKVSALWERVVNYFSEDATEVPTSDSLTDDSTRANEEPDLYLPA